MALEYSTASVRPWRKWTCHGASLLLMSGWGAGSRETTLMVSFTAAHDAVMGSVLRAASLATSAGGRLLSRARKPSVRGVLMWEMAWSDKREGERAHARPSTSSSQQRSHRLVDGVCSLPRPLCVACSVFLINDIDPFITRFTEPRGEFTATRYGHHWRGRGARRGRRLATVAVHTTPESLARPAAAADRPGAAPDH